MKWLKYVMRILFACSVICMVVYLFIQIKNEDLREPVLSCNPTEIKASIHDSQKDLLKGVTAMDPEEGDLTDSVFLEGIKKNPEGDQQEFTATYVSIDKAGNIGKTSRKLEYTDYNSPHFNIDSPLRFSKSTAIDLMSIVHANDCIDGDISAFVKVTGDDIFKEDIESGIYKCSLEVENSLGDTAVLPVSVEIYEDSYEKTAFEPQIYLKQYILYMKKGEQLNPADFVAYVKDGSVKQIERGSVSEGENTESQLLEKAGEWISIADISYKSNVDSAKKGNYSVIYNYTSKETGYSGNAELIVVVE